MLPAILHRILRGVSFETRARTLLVGALIGACGPGVSPAAEPSEELSDLSLERLMDVRIDKVIGASKYEQKVTQAPAAVTIVTADDIARYGHRTLADVLRSVRGLYVSNDSNYSYLGSRGFLRPGDYNTRTLVLVDGHRMNENVYDSASYGRENMVDAGDIDRVEIIRGPSSSIYGSSAFFGVINVVTRRGRQIDGWETDGAIGSFGSREGIIRYGRLFRNELELSLSASYFQTDGRSKIYYPEFDPRITDDPRASNNGVAERSDAEGALKLLGNLKFQDLTIAAFFARRDKTVPTASFLTEFNSGRQTTEDVRGYVDVRYEHDFNRAIRLSARASYDNFGYFGDYPTNYELPGDPVRVVDNRDEVSGEWISTEWQTTATLFDRHTVVAGLDYRENLQQTQINYDEGNPRQYYVNDSSSSQVLGAYAQTELVLRSNLLLNGGLRYDHFYGGFGGTLNPRLGLIYNPAQHTTVKALFGQAFRAPNAYERIYYADTFIAELTPEKIRTYELVLEHYFAGDYRLGLSAYHYNVSDLISQIALPGGEFTLANVDQYEAEGIEIEFEGRFGRGIHLRTSYALQRARDEGTGLRLTSSPQHLAKLNLAVPVYRDRLTAGLEYQYHSAARTLRGAKAGDFMIGNFTVTAHELASGVELSMSVYNMFDTPYGYPGAEDHAQDIIRQEGRSLRLKLSGHF